MPIMVFNKATAMALFASTVASGCSAGADANGAPDPRPNSPTVSHPAPAGVARAAKLPAFYVNGAIYVEGSVNGTAVLFHVDTASWFTRISKKAAASIGIKDVDHAVSLGSGQSAVDRGIHRVVPLDAAGDDYPIPGSKLRVAGTAGNDLFAGLRIGFNFRDDELWLIESEGKIERPAKTGPETAMQAQHLFGTKGQDAGGVLFVACGFSGKPNELCLVDTGSPDTVALEKPWLAASHSYTAQFSVSSVAFDGTILKGYYQRADRFVADTLATPGEPALVFPTFSILEEEGKFFGVNVAGLVGVSSFERSFTVFDFVTGRISMFAYEAAMPPARDAAFVGHGMFVVEATAQGAKVRVVPNSNMAKAGVVDGDEIINMDRPYSYTYAGIVGDPVGARRRFVFLRNGKEWEVRSAAEDFLPFTEK